MKINNNDIRYFEIKRENLEREVLFYLAILAGLARFELAHARVKVWCLTAWLQPIILYGVEDGTRTHGLQCHKLAR